MEVGRVRAAAVALCRTVVRLGRRPRPGHDPVGIPFATTLMRRRDSSLRDEPGHSNCAAGASTPWYVSRCVRGLGTSAASRSRKAKLPVTAWHDVIDEPTFADAILDRVRHCARTNGASMAHSTTPVGSNSKGIPCGAPPTALPKKLTKAARPDIKNPCLRGNDPQVTGYPGMTDRMLSEQLTGCVGMRTVEREHMTFGGKHKRIKAMMTGVLVVLASAPPANISGAQA